MAKQSALPKSLIVLGVDKLSDDDTTVTVEVETLTSEPFLRSVNKVSGREFVLPLQDALTLKKKALSLVAEEMGEKLTIQRCKLYHPKKLARYVVSEYEDDEASDVVLRSSQDDPSDEDPVLIWCGDSVGDSKNNGWRLSIVGFENLQSRLRKPMYKPDPEDIKILSLGFASWDDREGIMALVKSMRDTDLLAVMAALIDPESAIQRVALDISAKVLRGLKTKITPDAINEMVEESDELAVSYGQASSIRIDQYRLDGKNILLSITPPSIPLFKGSGLPPEIGFFQRRSLRHIARKHNRLLTSDQIKAEKDAKRRAEVSRWMGILLDIAKSKGWRQIDFYHDPLFDRVTITTISEEDWILLEPVIGEVNSVRDTRFDFNF